MKIKISSNDEILKWNKWYVNMAIIINSIIIWMTLYCVDPSIEDIRINTITKKLKLLFDIFKIYPINFRYTLVIIMLNI